MPKSRFDNLVFPLLHYSNTPLKTGKLFSLSAVRSDLLIRAGFQTEIQIIPGGDNAGNRKKTLGEFLVLA